MNRTLHSALILSIAFAAGSAAAQPAASPHGELAIDCLVCHGDTSWRTGDGPMAFDHDTTGFPLRGAHARVACEFCHQTLVFARIGSLCADCHVDAHGGSLGFDCEQCHSERGWENRNRMRDRHDQTAFPLRGAHRQADCAACHSGPPETAYAGLPVDCYACHRADYDATSAPAHGPSGFDFDCTLCHDPFGASWIGKRFLHPLTFPLTGAHVSTPCTSCHTTGYAGIPTDCYACHRTDYETATDPDHQAASFPTDCIVCHGTGAWTPADFDHAATAFPLTGAHAATDCLGCHSSGYTGTATNCSACHQAEYDATTNPGHAGSGFPLTCADCHRTSAWSPADWNHDLLFPIYSGKHRNEWNSCADCHLTASDYSRFECIYCHEHSRSETDGHHREVRNYVYTSIGCFQCHPRGNSD